LESAELGVRRIDVLLAAERQTAMSVLLHQERYAASI